jgi:hypothetical protein
MNCLTQFNKNKCIEPILNLIFYESLELNCRNKKSPVKHWTQFFHLVTLLKINKRLYQVSQTKGNIKI